MSKKRTESSKKNALFFLANLPSRQTRLHDNNTEQQREIRKSGKKQLHGTWSLAQLMVGSAHKRAQNPLASTLYLSQTLRVCDYASSASHTADAFECFKLAKIIQNMPPSVQVLYFLTFSKAFLKRNNALKFSGIPPFLASYPVPSSVSRVWPPVFPPQFLCF